MRLAESHVASRRPGRGPSPLDHLSEQERLLRDAHKYFVQVSEAQGALSYAAEWLLDNFYVVQQAVRQVGEDMPKDYYRRLPKLDTPPLRDYPRVYALAWEVIKYCQARLDIDRLTRFVQAYQRVTALMMGELWALPTMLRLAILELLSQRVARIIGGQTYGEDSSLAVSLPHDLADEAVVANCIRSLHTLATEGWKAFFEKVSRADQVLRSDPTGTYGGMDFDSRDRYRGVVEELARRTDQDEERVAQEAIRLAEETERGGQGSPRITHVGFYLLDTGRAQLEARLGYIPSWTVRVRRWLFGHATVVYLGAITLLTVVILVSLLAYARAAAGMPIQLIGASLLCLLPASAVAVSLVNWLITRTVPPRVLPKMEFRQGIPAEYGTMVVVPALLGTSSEIEFLLHQLELHYLGNADPHLHFALLTDFADAPQEHMPEDDALIEEAKCGVQALNKKYGRGGSGPFYLFHRYRQWNPNQDHWMGWERKRGKLVEFHRLLRASDDTSYSVQVGDLDVLPKIKYIITLDADTMLPRDSARRLIATLAHPLNRAQFDPDSGAVVAGYTVLQPRVEIQPTSADRSLFARVFSGDTGLDLYTRAVSDVYQDFFGEGIYVGKGIYDVAAFERSLAGRVPDNALLSHDLFEGIHGRAGLVTDVTLFEDYPPDYLSYAHRLHRWVRGDWQLLPWLLPRVPSASGGKIPNRLSTLDRWKILDNLRRSLLAPALMALLIAGWLWLPGSALMWTLTVLVTYAIPLATSVITELVQRSQDASLSNSVPALRVEVVRWLLALVFLPHSTLITLDAILTTLIRLIITRKRLLQWTTAAHTVRLLGQKRSLALIWQQMRSAPFLTLGLALLVGVIDFAVLPIAVPLLLAWLMSPQVVYWISKPLVRRQAPLSGDQRQQLRRLARRTWLYFEQFVGPDDHWLPPDHFQEKPRGLVAHRTSPTNLGLLLLSILAAHDLGYIGPTDLALRLRSAFENMSKLERYRGHFLNWYDTHSLEPLPPRYVSTVDSGNLAGSLLVLKQGLQALPDQPVLGWQRWEGLVDALDILSEIVEGLKGVGLQETVEPLEAHLAHMRREVSTVQDVPERWASLLTQLSGDGQQELDRLLRELVESGSRVLDAATLRDLHLWLERVHYHLRSAHDELDRLLPWLLPQDQPPTLFTQAETDPAVADAWRALQDELPATPRLDEVPEICRTGRARLAQVERLLPNRAGPTDQDSAELAERVEEARVWCQQLAEELDSAQIAAKNLLTSLRDLSAQAEAYFHEMGFGFLFDLQRQVLHLGYNLAAGRLDPHHYDLFASEARIASLVAIAKGDVPQSHWLHLDRPLSQVDGRRMLLSWNGSMFEYLMPTLLTRSYEGTLLDQTYKAVVERQIAYARRKDVPWGVSESGYHGFDASQNYQYRGFGVPGLGFKRGLGDDLVIASYASLLALPVDPQAVMRNVVRLIEQQMLGHYGFYEAIDYTPSRLPRGQKKAIVRSYYAHHQGMILLALTNYLQQEAMVRRFHADPRVRSVELLLQEQVPQQAPVEQVPEEVVGMIRPIQPRIELGPWRAPTDAPLPQVHFLSNGHYSVLITSAGSGYSTYLPRGAKDGQKMDLTRWRSDSTLDDWGTWIYVQDRDTGILWSAGYQPTGASPEEQEVLFYTHQAEFRRRDHDISLRMEITVAPKDDVEIRRITLTNHSDRSRRLMLSSYGEVALAPQRADRHHPAFNKLFIQSEYRPELNCQLFHRRPRSAQEEPLYLAHLLVSEPGREITGAHESDRARFLRRAGTPRSPVALSGNSVGLSGSTGAVLDPIMALGQEIVLEPHGEAHVAYVTLAAESREDALAVARRYESWSRVDRAFEEARRRGEVELRQLGLDASHVEHIQQLLSVLLYPGAALRADAETLAANSKGQSGLWSYAISGDYPILLARIGSQGEVGLVRELLRAHAYWRDQQLKIDLVILNQRDVGYAQELHHQLHELITRTDSDGWLNCRGGIFLLRAEQMSEADQVLLETAARAILDGEKGPLAEQLAPLRERPARLPAFVPTLARPEDVEPTPALARPADLQFDNGLGGFSTDGREYVIYLKVGQQTPAPWINVIANPHFGFLVSEAGSGYTWAENSSENRLTPWRNDPVTDAPGEALYLRDEETGQVWSPTPLPAGEAAYLIRHGAGYSIFEHHSHGLKQRLRLFAVRDAPVKVVQLRLENTWNRIRRITATFYAEWVLGADRDVTQQYIVPEYDPASSALLARNAYNEEFGERVAFVVASKDPHGLTTDRTEFLGREGTLLRPAALDRVGLAGAVKPGLDPCAALQIHLDLAPGEVRDVFFLLGQGADRGKALRLIEQCRDAERVEAAWESLTRFWDDLLGAVKVETPDPAMDLLLNRWLLYQTLACRLWARSSLHQSSGAFGYRDELQDVMALFHAAPDIAREHILRAACHQFEEGDVMHWWHPPSGHGAWPGHSRGVRTRISDDLLWLPYVTAAYVEATGDEPVLNEKVPFRKGEPLAPGEEERYGPYPTTDQEATLYEHCRRALKRGTTAGPHGLPLIGSGDWNDGLNRMGIEGRGESVWLGWFLHATLTAFASLCERIGEEERATIYRHQARGLRQALEETAWDGNWYRRAYYDDGTPLGSAQSRECQIASIAQSWAVLSGAADEERAARAMEAVADRLVQWGDRLVLLLTPPFDETRRDPGYIKGYPPGIRENGGQYTHAALWAVWAFAELGQGDRAAAVLRLLNPIYQSDTPEKAQRYQVEPYVVAADVHGAPPHVGRGGWTWYTGSAGWMYRLGLEAILGLRRRRNTLQINPCIPKDWPGYEVTYRARETSYRICVENPDGVNRGTKQIMLDGEILSGNRIPLVGDGREHEVHVLMG